MGRDFPLSGQSDAQGLVCLGECLSCAFWVAASGGGWALALAVFGAMGWVL